MKTIQVFSEPKWSCTGNKKRGYDILPPYQIPLILLYLKKLSTYNIEDLFVSFYQTK